MKTDRQIVDEVNALAHNMALYIGTGYSATPGFKFYRSQNPRAQRAWTAAVEAYELITQSEVHDALLAVEEEERRSAQSDPLAEQLRGIAELSPDKMVPGSPRAEERKAALLAAAERIDELARIRRQVKAYNDRLDDPDGDGSGNNARAPDGDDFNRICEFVGY